MVMACTHPGDNWLPNGDVLFMDWVLQGVSWDDVPGGSHVGGCNEWAMCLFLVGS